MFFRGAVFAFMFVVEQRDEVGGTLLFGFVPPKTDCSASSV